MSAYLKSVKGAYIELMNHKSVALPQYSLIGGPYARYRISII